MKHWSYTCDLSWKITPDGREMWAQSPQIKQMWWVWISMWALDVQDNTKREWDLRPDVSSHMQEATTRRIKNLYIQDLLSDFSQSCSLQVLRGARLNTYTSNNSYMGFESSVSAHIYCALYLFFTLQVSKSNTTEFICVEQLPLWHHYSKGSSLCDLSAIRASLSFLPLYLTCDEMLPGKGDFMDLPNTLPRKSNFLQRGKGYSWNIYRVKIKLEKTLNDIWILLSPPFHR